jgi:hypothetical protein
MTKKQIITFILEILIFFGVVQSAFSMTALNSGRENARLLSGNKLTFEVKGEDGGVLKDAIIILSGVSDQNYLATARTGSEGIAVFENVPPSSIYAYTIFKNGYKSFSSTVFLLFDKRISVKMESFGETDWWDYYENNNEVEILFNSYDGDTIYSGGEQLNYEVRMKNIGGKEIQITEKDLHLQVLDELNGKITWGGLDPEMKFQLTLKAGGYIKMTANGNNVKITFSNGVAQYDGKTVSITSGEFVTITKETYDNVIPTYLNGRFHIKFRGEYISAGAKKSLTVQTQEFTINNDGSDLTARNLKVSKIKGKYYASFDVINTGKINLNGVFYELKTGDGWTYHNKIALKMNAGKKTKINIPLPSGFQTSSGVNVFVDYENKITESNEENNKLSA